MSRESIFLSKMALCFPRVSGDEPYVSRGTEQSVKFSPRERG